jgi:hypothetical protein
MASNTQKPFTYIDPRTGQQNTVMVSAVQRKQLKRYLKNLAKQVKQQQKLAGKQPLQLPEIGGLGMAAPVMQPSFPMNQPLVSGSQPFAFNQNILTQQPLSCGVPQTGWIGPTLSAMAASSRFAMSLDPENSIFVNTTNPLMLGYRSAYELLGACQLAVQGVSNKEFSQALWPAVPADTTVTPTATTVFGVRIRITNSVLNFKFGTYSIQIKNGATVQSTIQCVVRKLPLDIVVLSISNNAGIAQVVPNIAPAATWLLATNPALVANSDVLYVETLNQRDIGTIGTQAPVQFPVIGDTYDVYDAASDNGEDD